MSQRELLNRIQGIKVLVVGDVMLDVYRVGEATRISPEAPVPVLLNPKTEQRPGGAAAVAAMCAALGAEVVLLGVTGKDRHGEVLDEMLEEQGVTSLLLADPGRPTTVKERICGVSGGRHRQQLGRVDYESTAPIPREISEKMVQIISQISEHPPEVILIADYAKGVMTPEVVAACNQACELTIVDPPRGGDWQKYRNCGCLVPNREEAGGQSSRMIFESLNLLAAVVKLDQDGCELYSLCDPHEFHYPARARAVHDVTGAGDEFLAVFGLASAVNLDWWNAAALANVAAGLQVERHGCVPVTRTELLAELRREAKVKNTGRPLLSVG